MSVSHMTPYMEFLAFPKEARLAEEILDSRSVEVRRMCKEVWGIAELRADEKGHVSWPDA